MTTALAHEIKRTIVDESKRAGVGHIGSALSIADLVAALYGGVLRADGGPERDRFVLSKGHAVLALYAALVATGRMPSEQLATYCGDGTLLGAHPEHALDGVDFSTGSLGQGLSIGAGAALAARMQGSDRRVFVLLSDAECNEGSIWEAAMFAAHAQLANLVAIVDVNGQQALGYTRDVLDPGPPASARWEACGWEVHEVDGHDPDGIAAVVAELDLSSGPPHVLLARTVFGKGVSFMESRIEWHYLPLDDAQHAQAVAELDSAREA
ncbi:transketolase [Conexibacter stalactiti]|uniref:Transketolase n=1 Tax=Conexibacter stalactiti TaxID=1940611 RepID=A0ABU4HSE2_9ACTN|nr:transketolase [Conexibacter stalactiti]MDW5596160.1 transketolase [Conexibacter stalactiti]MEC5036802.1 transketolase [Conexibacter stalactiti]